MEELMARIESDFTYHPPKPGQAEEYTNLRNEYKNLARLLVATCPRSRELSVALTELETSNMWANASIARNGE